MAVALASRLFAHLVSRVTVLGQKSVELRDFFFLSSNDALCHLSHLGFFAVLKFCQLNQLIKTAGIQAGKLPLHVPRA